jgi:hypothetical protein
MGKQVMKGKIYKGSAVHAIYEVIMTQPNEKFIIREIGRVQNVVTRLTKMGIVEQTDKKRYSIDAKRQVPIFRRYDDVPQPTIHEKSDAVNRKTKTKQPFPKKKDTPNEVSATELGESVIAYVNHLEGRVSDLALSLRDVQGKAKTQEGALRKEIQTLNYQIDGLKRNNEDLQKKVNAKGSTFNTSRITDFKQRKAKSHGF